MATFGLADYQAQKEEARKLLDNPIEAVRKLGLDIIAKADKAIAKIHENTAKLGDGVNVLAGQNVFAYELPQHDKEGNIVRLRIIERIVDMVKKDQEGRGYVYFGTIKEGERASTIEDVAADVTSKAKRYEATKWFSTSEAAQLAAAEAMKAKVNEARARAAKMEELILSIEHDEPTEFDLTGKSLVLEAV